MDPQTLARLALLSAILAVSANGASVSNTTTSGTTSPASSGTAATYIVQAGDTLYAIALKYNTTIAELQQLNNIADPTTLSIGTRLIIPGAIAQNVVTPAPTARGPTPTLASGASPPLTAGASGGGEVETYIVRSGDTLASIAAQFGVPMAELQRINNIANANILNVGQRLIIPKITETSVALPDGVSLVPQVVRQGETVTLRVKGENVSEVLGTFDRQALRFNRQGGDWAALIGISRCANYIGEYPVKLTLRDTLGNPQNLEFGVRVNAGTFPTEDLTLTAEMSALLDPAIMDAENALVSRTVTPVSGAQLWKSVFRSPLDIPNPRVSSQFGERRSYNGGQPGLCGHEGQDYGVPGGTPIYAPGGGIVVLAQELKVRGNVVFLDHGRGVFSAFYHMSELDVKNGDRVKAGDLLGKVGTTGFSTGNHLHWSMWVNGIYVDPIDWTERALPAVE
ncbi:MAG: LysM peptidoglycan-binding domain-containing M23 family metallopeptidase [Anaerolineae bacterium]|nr:LysM peptidoglycan-binding domain-containing M23 family metallopeptidase [Anaerolineae bacterium]